MEGEKALCGKRGRGVHNRADPREVEVAAAKVSDAVPTIRAREVKNFLIARLVPRHFLRCDESFT